jgi:hypothetical protein
MRTDIHGDANKRILTDFPCLKKVGGGDPVIIVVCVTPSQRLSLTTKIRRT